MVFFGFKNTLPRILDLILIKDSFIQALKKLPWLIQKNILLIPAFIVLEVCYFQFLLPMESNEIIRTLARFSFSMLQWAFLIFLIPFQLYNQGAGALGKSLLQFQAFLARSIWPVIIDPIKAFFIILAYFILALILGSITFALIYFGGFEKTTSSGLLIMGIGGFFAGVFVLMSVIKAMQFSFIPMVIFFSRKYIEEKKSSLTLSVQVSRGLPFILILYWGAYSFFVSYLLINKVILNLFSAESGWLFTDGPLAVGVMSLINIISVIHSCAFCYFIYTDKDKDNSI